MPRFAIRQEHDAGGKPVGWVLITVPDDFDESSGLYPAPASTDRRFDTREEAIRALTGEPDPED